MKRTILSLFLAVLVLPSFAQRIAVDTGLPGILSGLSVGNGQGVVTNLSELALGEVVLPPAGFTPPFTVYRKGNQYWTSAKMSDYKNALRSTTRYLLFSGSDTNDGLSWATAKASLGSVVSNLVISATIYCGPGDYSALYSNLITSTKDISLICTGGVAQFGQFVLSEDKSGYFENVRFTSANSGHAFAWNNSTNTSATLAMDRCQFLNAQGEDGFAANANFGFVYLRDCGAYSNRMDGIGYQALSGTSTLWALEERCMAAWNGWTTNNANNGSTIHSGVSIVRIGGYAYRNEGRNYHDIGTGLSWNINCQAGGSRISGAGNDVGFACASAADASTMVLDGCSALFGSPLSYLYGTNGTLILMPSQGIDYAQVSVNSEIVSSTTVQGSGFSATGSIVTSSTTDSTGIGTGSIRTSGGAAIAKTLWVGTGANIAGTTRVGALVASNSITGSNLVATLGGLTLPVLSAAPSNPAANFVTLWVSNDAASTLWILRSDGSNVTPP